VGACCPIFWVFEKSAKSGFLCEISDWILRTYFGFGLVGWVFLQMLWPEQFACHF